MNIEPSKTNLVKIEGQDKEPFILIPDLMDMTAGLVEAAGIPIMHLAFAIITIFLKPDKQIQCFPAVEWTPSGTRDLFNEIFWLHIVCFLMLILSELIKAKSVTSYMTAGV